MSKQNQLGGIDDFKEFKSDSSKQNQLGGSDALGKIALGSNFVLHAFLDTGFNMKNSTMRQSTHPLQLVFPDQ